LAELIGQFPDEFLALLGEDTDNDAPLPPGTQSIPVTEEERAAIERVWYSKSSSLLVILIYSSYVFWDSLETKQSKHTLLATKTKSLLPISCLSNLKKMIR